MQPSLRGLLIAAALAAAALPTAGCDVSSGFKLVFRDFDSSAVEGVRLWKLDRGRRVWDEVLVLEFGDTIERGGVEFLIYTAPVGSGGRSVDLFTKLERFGDGNVVRLRFGLLRLGPGDYKISAFNEAGDSPLSAGTYSPALNAS